MIALDGKEVIFKHYPDGESRWNQDDYDLNYATKDVTLRYENDEDLIHLMLLKHDLDKVPTTGWLKLILTHVPYARMDRARPGAPHSNAFSLHYVAEFINWLEFSEVELRDPHSDVSGALFWNAREVSCMDELVRRVLLKPPFVGRDRDVVLVFPDAGAQKKYERFADQAVELGRSVFVGFKHRDFETGTIDSVRLFEAKLGVDNPRVALIVDDLSSYGGTFVRTAEALKEWGIEEVHLVVAHCEDSAWDGDLRLHINTVTTTDSMVDRTDKGFAAAADWMFRYSQDELLSVPQTGRE